MDAHTEEDLGIPWLDRCLRFAFPTYPEGTYVSYDYGQEGDSKQEAEAFCVTPTGFLLATMGTERRMGQPWELQTLKVTRVPLLRIRQVQTTTELLSAREQADSIHSFEITIEMEGDLQEPWRSPLTLPRERDYNDARKAAEAARRFEKTLTDSLERL